MPTGIECKVYAVSPDTGEPVRLADGSPGDDLLAPTVLEDLKITWGRDTTVDQPAASTCSFRMVDYAGGTSLIGDIRMGIEIIVDAELNETYIPPDYNAWPDGTFSDPDIWANVAKHVPPGGPSPMLRIGPAAGENGGPALIRQDGAPSVQVAPLEFLTFGEPTGQWDSIPQINYSADWPRDERYWDCIIRLQAEAGTTVRIGYTYFESPYGGTASGTTYRTLTASGDWEDVSFQLLGSTSSNRVWPGIYINTNTTGRVVIDNVIFRPRARAFYRTSVFRGRITSVKQAWDDSLGGPVYDVEAADFTTDLENTIVGAEPWPVQTIPDRFATIAALTDLPTTNGYAIAPTFASTRLSWRDVDAQGAMGLFGEISSSVDGVLWSAISTDYGQSFLLLEDPAARPSTRQLALDAGTNKVVIVPLAFEGLELSACDVLRDGVEWVQDVQDVTSRVSVTWKRQGVDDDGNNATTDVTETLTNYYRNQKYGQRSVSVSTQLQSAMDARDVANRLLVRTAGNTWRASSFTIDDRIAAIGSIAPGVTGINYFPDPDADGAEFNWPGAGTDPVIVFAADRNLDTTTVWRWDEAVPANANVQYVASGVVNQADGQWTLSGWYRTPAGATYSLRLGGSGLLPTTSETFTGSGDWELRSLTVPTRTNGNATAFPVYESSDWVEVDTIGLAPGPDAAQFTGDTPSDEMVAYSWQGEPYASPSVETLLQYRPREDYRTAILSILNANNRNGLPVQVTEMPYWPATSDATVDGTLPAYLEGGTYTFSDGAWVLELDISSPTDLGGTAAWNEMDPAWTWDQFDPLRWMELYGVTGPVQT